MIEAILSGVTWIECCAALYAYCLHASIHFSCEFAHFFCNQIILRQVNEDSTGLLNREAIDEFCVAGHCVPVYYGVHDGYYG